jgi:hypothetical protein
VLLGSGEGFGGGLAPLHGTEASLDTLRELLAGLALHAFHLLFHPAVRPDAEADGFLSHP